MSKRLRTISYILADFLSAGLAWTFFNYYRKMHVDSVRTGRVPE